MKSWKSFRKKISPRNLATIRQANKKEKTQTQKDVERLMQDLKNVKKRLEKNPNEFSSREEAGYFVIRCDELLMRPEVMTDSTTYDKVTRIRDAMLSYTKHYDEIVEQKEQSQEFLEKLREQQRKEQENAQKMQEQSNTDKERGVKNDRSGK